MTHIPPTSKDGKSRGWGKGAMTKPWKLHRIYFQGGMSVGIHSSKQQSHRKSPFLIGNTSSNCCCFFHFMLVFGGVPFDFIQTSLRSLKDADFVGFISLDL